MPEVEPMLGMNMNVVEEDTRRRPGRTLNSNREPASLRGRCDCHLQMETARHTTQGHNPSQRVYKFQLIQIINNISELLLITFWYIIERCLNVKRTVRVGYLGWATEGYIIPAYTMFASLSALGFMFWASLIVLSHILNAQQDSKIQMQCEFGVECLCGCSKYSQSMCSSNIAFHKFLAATNYVLAHKMEFSRTIRNSRAHVLNQIIL